ncbi:MAG TPA: aldose 1-epimerase [Casimicrobiaceae bacterium]|nr:aldose 1-epimerase [Casimicrobiaceae bacterium]
MTPAPIELVAGSARVALLPATGGAIASFTWRGRDVLRRMPAGAQHAGNVRLAACYPLVPYSNRIRDAQLRFDGVTHPLARNFGDHPHSIHGVGWQRTWRVLDASPCAAMMVYAHTTIGDDALAWPWPFTAMQAHDLAADDTRACLTLSLTIANTGDTRFPFGLGWHPFFPRDTSTTLRFDGRDVWLNDATQLPVAQAAAQGPWSFATARDPGIATIDNVFTDWRGVATLASSQRQLITTIAADRACNRVVVYAPARRDFLAVEPVSHETDAFNRALEGASGTGTRVLRPGEAFSCTMRIDVTTR